MAIDSINPVSDPRVSHHHADLNGKTYRTPSHHRFLPLTRPHTSSRLPPRQPNCTLQRHNLPSTTCPPLSPNPQPSNPPPSPKIHGWPDLSIGWRYQIPSLLSTGYRVVCPDIMGFGRTAAPRVPPESIENYSFKRAAADIKALAQKMGLTRIILGGHDWVSDRVSE